MICVKNLQTIFWAMAYNIYNNGIVECMPRANDNEQIYFVHASICRIFKCLRIRSKQPFKNYSSTQQRKANFIWQLGISVARKKSGKTKKKIQPRRNSNSCSVVIVQNKTYLSTNEIFIMRNCQFFWNKFQRVWRWLHAQCMSQNKYKAMIQNRFVVRSLTILFRCFFSALLLFIRSMFYWKTGKCQCG